MTTKWLNIISNEIFYQKHKKIFEGDYYEEYVKSLFRIIDELYNTETEELGMNIVGIEKLKKKFEKIK